MLIFTAGIAGACGGGTAGNDGSDDETGGGVHCGFATNECSDDKFCDDEFDWCGHPLSGEGGSLVCRPRVGSCDADVKVCGCDGKVYDNECAAHLAGTDIGGPTICGSQLTPKGTFPCGPLFCDAAKSFCDYGEGDQGDRSTACKPLPAACGGTGTCACVTSTDSEASCETVDGNGVTGVMLRTVWQ